MPRFKRTGKRKENRLAEGKTVLYTMNDLSCTILKEVCDTFKENKTGALRLALGVARFLPAERLSKPENEKYHSTVRLNRNDSIRIEKLKDKLNNNGNAVFRTGLFIATRELKKLRLGLTNEMTNFSKESSLYKMTEEIPADTVRQNIILKP